MQQFIQRRIDAGKPITEEQKRLIELAKKNLERVDHVPLVESSTTSKSNVHTNHSSIKGSTTNKPIKSHSNHGKFKKEQLKKNNKQKNKNNKSNPTTVQNQTLEVRISTALSAKR